MMKGSMMKCPVCDAPLRAIQKHGVEIDICPECKGVWLDRGELEKIIELAATVGSSVNQTVEPGTMSRPRMTQTPSSVDHRGNHDERDDEDDEHRRPQYDQQGRPLRKKRGSWLGDLLGGIGGDD